jgi:glycosyltransferase involved in cell wall biosynthesis
LSLPDPLDLLIVIYGPASRRAGAAQMALNLAEALRRRGHRVRTWPTDEPPPTDPLAFRRYHRWRLGRLAEVLADDPAPLVDVPPLLAAAPALRGRFVIARSVQPDVRYALAEWPGRLRRLPQAPVRTLYDLAVEARRLATSVAGLHRARLVFCLGSHEKRELRQVLPWLRNRLEVLVNAVEPAEREILAGLRRARTAPDGPGVRYLWLGRWSAHKGTARLVRFLRQAIPARPEDRFTLAGCGDAPRADLPAAGLETDRIRIVPSFGRDELPGLLAEHDAGLFTSSVEGWGLSLNEMLESGMPVWATRAGGVEDLEPYFPRLLRPFPPPTDARAVLGGLSAEDREPGPGYDARHDWDAIAEHYELAVRRRLPDRTHTSGGLS